MRQDYAKDEPTTSQLQHQSRELEAEIKKIENQQKEDKEDEVEVVQQLDEI